MTMSMCRPRRHGESWSSTFPMFFTEEVSDHAMALILMIARRVLHGQKAVREGKWGPMAIDFNSFKRVKEQTLGLYGFGPHRARGGREGDGGSI